MNEITSNGWNEYKQRVFFQLDSLTKQVEVLDRKVTELKEDVIILKVKAWGFGIIGGAVVTAIIQIALRFFGK